jgi:hypothetical protein
MTTLLTPTYEQHWVCPNCTITAVTHDPRPHTQYHYCRGSKIALLASPMVHDGTKCKIEVVERQDYIGTEIVQTNAAGRPIMSTVTTRDDGQDTTVYAPLATINLQEIEWPSTRPSIASLVQSLRTRVKPASKSSKARSATSPARSSGLPVRSRP